jgi:hypothetical protein
MKLQQARNIHVHGKRKKKITLHASRSDESTDSEDSNVRLKQTEPCSVTEIIQHEDWLKKKLSL